MRIWCCGCGKETKARLTDGREIYPQRKDLRNLPFWKCDTCKNYVGCHHKTEKPTTPLGCIPTKEIRKARGHIHHVLDPIWKGKHRTRRETYQAIAARIGADEYHTSDIRTVEDARKVFRAVIDYRREIGIPL